MGKYPVGSEVAILMSFTAPPQDDPEGPVQPDDPDTITLTVTEPDGAVVEYGYPGGITRRLEGEYYAKHLATKRGIYAYSVQATGVTAANRGYFEAF